MTFPLARDEVPTMLNEDGFLSCSKRNAHTKARGGRIELELMSMAFFVRLKMKLDTRSRGSHLERGHLQPHPR